jgi:hypothetical protein
MPDFGIMRGFNEKLFGDKLVAGQLPTQLGLIGSQEVFNTDVDALAFFARVTAAGGTLSTTEKEAVNQLVLDLKANSLWTPMKAIYPMVGASAAACAQNLKSSSFTGTFTSGWTFASEGATSNGSNAYFNTNCIVSDSITRDSGSFGIYSNTDRVGSTDKLIGAYKTSTNGFVGMYIRYNLNLFISYLNSNSGSLYSSVTNTLGFRAISRISSTLNYIQYNNIQTTTAIGSTGETPLNLYIGAINIDGSATGFDTLRMAFSYLSLGLDSTQLSTLQTKIQAFQTTLSRQV